MAQWKNPAQSGEYTEEVKIKLKEFDIPVDLQLIESMSNKYEDRKYMHYRNACISLTSL